MIQNIVQPIKDNLAALNIFCELAGLVKPLPNKEQILPFSCDLSLDDCKNGTEVTPSNKNKMVGFFERISDMNELDFGQGGSCSPILYEATVGFVVWYNCDSITVNNAGESIDCCQKQGFIQEKIISTIKGTAFTSNLFSNVTLQQISVREYNFNRYKFNERLKHHPFYAFEVVIPVQFILNANCGNVIDIEITKEEC